MLFRVKTFAPIRNSRERTRSFGLMTGSGTRYCENNGAGGPVRFSTCLSTHLENVAIGDGRLIISNDHDNGHRAWCVVDLWLLLELMRYHQIDGWPETGSAGAPITNQREIQNQSFFESLPMLKLKTDLEGLKSDEISGSAMINVHWWNSPIVASSLVALGRVLFIANLVEKKPRSHRKRRNWRYVRI